MLHRKLPIKQMLTITKDLCFTDSHNGIKYPVSVTRHSDKCVGYVSDKFSTTLL